ncbi:hypothetical protein ACFWIA_26330 [Streptomyces sp. NPDC127068]|uniref:hypothetical protein n=1 Tax=Streptomyces sp. NPDC127068 TaxID=3347127 RepID=UPI003664A838
MKLRLTADEEDGLFQLLRSLHTFLTACQDEDCPELRPDLKAEDTSRAPLNGIPSPADRTTHSHAYTRSTTPHPVPAHPADADRGQSVRSAHPHHEATAPGGHPGGHPHCARGAHHPGAVRPTAVPAAPGEDAAHPTGAERFLTETAAGPAATGPAATDPATTGPAGAAGDRGATGLPTRDRAGATARLEARRAAAEAEAKAARGG